MSSVSSFWHLGVQQESLWKQSFSCSFPDLQWNPKENPKLQYINAYKEKLKVLWASSTGTKNKFTQKGNLVSHTSGITEYIGLVASVGYSKGVFLGNTS
jgi:hypothetical protein